ncbi:integrase core domain-containing protein, partial [Lactococcus garvieae]|uniref:integrase core domain-containing protein n=1 Tax=Lactococcus garvieae TaxID=1363 RepID=UPI003851AF45
HRTNDGLILQTDRGSQYLSNAYEKRLNALGIRHSYSQKGYPYNNSAIESFHASLKKEEVYQTAYPDLEAAKRALFSYIEGWYNQNRIHSSINFQTPNEFEKAA